MEQETKWKTEGTVEAASNEQSLLCCSLTECILFEQKACALIPSQCDALTAKQESLDMIRKTHHKN